MLATPKRQQMSIEQYLEWEPQQEIRYEYVNSEVIAMTGGTIPHNDIALNLYRALYPHIRAKGCRINVSDVKLQVSESSPYYYPDLIISCDPRDLNARKFIQHPKLLVEVLSPGTEAYDRGDKFTAYRSILTLQEYVLIDSEKVSIECFCRGEGRMWLYTPYTVGETLTLESVNWSGKIEVIYEDVRFDNQTQR